MADKPSSGTSWQTRLPKYGSQNRGTNTVVGPNDASIGRVSVAQPGDPMGPSVVPPQKKPDPAAPAAGNSGGLTPSPGSSAGLGNLPRTGGVAPAPPAPVTSKGVEGSPVDLGPSSGPSAPMIHGPIPKLNGPIVRPVAGPSFGPGLIPGRRSPGGYHPNDYGA